MARKTGRTQPTKRKGGLAQFFTNYGFENQTTSWTVNRSLNFVNVNDFGSNLWNESAFSASSNVRSARNDRADYFICYGQEA